MFKYSKLVFCGIAGMAGGVCLDRIALIASNSDERMISSNLISKKIAGIFLNTEVLYFRLKYIRTNSLINILNIKIDDQ